MTLYQAGFIELLRGTLAVRSDGTIATGRKRGVPRVEALRLLPAEHTWHHAYDVRTRVSLVVTPTLDGMRYAGLDNAVGTCRHLGILRNRI